MVNTLKFSEKQGSCPSCLWMICCCVTGEANSSVSYNSEQLAHNSAIDSLDWTQLSSSGPRCSICILASQLGGSTLGAWLDSTWRNSWNLCPSLSGRRALACSHSTSAGRVGLKGLWSPHSKLAHCSICHIPVVNTSHRASPIQVIEQHALPLGKGSWKTNDYLTFVQAVCHSNLHALDDLSYCNWKWVWLLTSQKPIKRPGWQNG